MIGLALVGGILIGGVVGIVVGTMNSESHNKHLWDKYMEGMNDGYWIGNQKELPKKTAVVNEQMYFKRTLSVRSRNQNNAERRFGLQIHNRGSTPIQGQRRRTESRFSELYRMAAVCRKRYVTEINVDEVTAFGNAQSGAGNTDDVVQRAQEVFGADMVEVGEEGLPF